MLGSTRRVRAALGAAITLAVVGFTVPLSVIALAAGLTGPDANLTAASQNVLPGAARPFSVKVSNGTAGEPVDYVSVALPASAAGISVSDTAVSAPAGWTVQVVDTASVQALKFKTAGAGIARGASLDFAFPAEVAAPAGGDRSGAFVVGISSDDGKTVSDAPGSLSTTVRVLEVTSQRAVAPAGVTDQSATAGQSITYDVTVRNHASAGLTVTPQLTSGGPDTITPAPAATLASGASHTFGFPVTLGTTSGTRTMTGSATSTGAQAVSATGSLAVQTRALIALAKASFSPQHVQSAAPIGYTFRVQANKTGDPALSLSSCTLSFANTTTGLTGGPLSFAEGIASQELTFVTTSVTGAEGVYDATVTCTGMDANNKPESYIVTLDKVVSIDNTLPVVTVNALGIPSGQDALKNGDAITIKGTAEAAGALDFVQLRTDRGQVIACANPSRSADSFSCSVPAGSVTFEPGTTAVHAEAQVTDKAGNIGAGSGPDVVVDLSKPALHFAETGVGDGLGDQVRVQFDESPQGRVIRGGCAADHWTVKGHTVLEVRYSDGSVCLPGQSGPAGAPDNYRLLMLADSVDTDETPDVAYRPSTLSSDNVRDGAGHLADPVTITAVTGIVPGLPDIMAVTRTDQTTGVRESSTVDGAGTLNGTVTYWTNQSGSDLEVTFAGSKAGYQVQVVDGAGVAITAPRLVSGTTGTVAIPIGATDARVVRGIQLINAKGAGRIAYFDVVLDRVAPAIENAVTSKTVIGETKVDIKFTDVLTAGRDFASDWWVLAAGGNVKQPNTVAGSRDTRTLTLKNYTETFGGVRYELSPDDEAAGAGRYEDRAGNRLVNHTWGSV